jgi:hypothetical protein
MTPCVLANVTNVLEKTDEAGTLNMKAAGSSETLATKYTVL